MFKVRGIYPVLPTIFDEKKEIIWEQTGAVIDFAIKAGAHGLVAIDNASEFITMTDAERKELVEFVLKKVNGRVPVIVSVTANTLEESLDWAKHAEANGATALISMAPYFKPQMGPRINTFFRALSKATKLPIIIEDGAMLHGSCAGAGLAAELIKDCENIIAVKAEYFDSIQMTSVYHNALKDLGDVLGGGLSCATILHEYNRGARFFTPPVELTDVFLSLWEAMEAGDEAKAWELYAALAPMLMLKGPYPRSSTKGVLRRRGVISSEYSREVSQYTFDAVNEKEVDVLMGLLQPYLKV